MAENVSTPTLGEIQDLKKRLRASEYLGNEYQKMIANLLSENGALKGNIEQLKDMHLQHLQCSGQLCAKNCALSAILWICQQKLGVSPCGLQLLLLLSKYESAGPTIEPENYKCHTLIMEIFIKCGVVAIAAQFPYPPELYAKLQVIEQVWNRVMTTDGSEHVMILGRVISVAEEKVHSVVFDLDLKTSDGSVTIYDPQKEGGNGNKDDFVDYVTKDEGLILYTVNLEKLNQIIKKYEHILHHTSQPNQSLTIPSLPQAQ